MNKLKICIGCVLCMMMVSGCVYDVIRVPYGKSKEIGMVIVPEGSQEGYKVLLVPDKPMEQAAPAEESRQTAQTEERSVKQSSAPVETPKPAYRSENLARRIENTTVEPISLSHTDFSRKKAFVKNAKNTLKQFRLIVEENRKLSKAYSVEELGYEAYRYIETYVRPLLKDAQVNQSPETRLDMAVIHILCAYLYTDLMLYNESEMYLELFERQYGRDGQILTQNIDQTDTGFATLAESIQYLEEMLYLKKQAQTSL